MSTDEKKCHKLYFHHGAMTSGKTMQLLAVAENYERQGKKVIIFKPACETRFGQTNVKSRIGIERKADVLVNGPEDISLDKDKYKGISCGLVEEAQFLSRESVDQFRKLTEFIPVMCYGLRTDFRPELFPGSQRLLALSDVVVEIKTTCVYCDRKAIFNKKIAGSMSPDVTVDLGAEDKYVAVCYSHF